MSDQPRKAKKLSLPFKLRKGQRLVITTDSWARLRVIFRKGVKIRREADCG